MKRLRNKEGFTLVELLVVMAIIAVIAVLAIGAIVLARRSATETANRASARTLQACLEANAGRNSGNFCGTAVAGQQMACAAVPASIETIRAALVTAGTQCNATAGVSTQAAGGGQVTALSATAYTIRPNTANGAAGDYLTDSYTNQ